MKIQSCVLAIWYTENGVKNHKPQGKIFQSGDNWFYVVNVDSKKFIRKYQGYSVAAQVLEAFENVGLKRVTVIFKDKEKHISYSTTAGLIKEKGVFDNFGSHRQFTLPLKDCSIIPYSNADPKGLPIVDLSDWSKGVEVKYEYIDNMVRISRIEPSVQMAIAL